MLEPLLLFYFKIGPRMTLQLVKIEEGFCSGAVLYHEFSKFSLLHERESVFTGGLCVTIQGTSLTVPTVVYNEQWDLSIKDTLGP